MIKKYLFLGITLLNLELGGCILNSKFSRSEDYQENTKVSDLHLIVIGDKETKEAMSYLNQFLKDSLIKNNIKTTETYYCCRDKDTNMNSLIPKLLPPNYKPEHILAAGISKVTVGYGTTSSRDIQLDLVNTTSQKRTWAGKVTVNMSWFRSDRDYRNVARSLTKTIMKELKKKKIV